MYGIAVLWSGRVPRNLQAVKAPAASAPASEWLSALRQASRGAEPQPLLARVRDAVDGAAQGLWCVFSRDPMPDTPVFCQPPQETPSCRARSWQGLARYSTRQPCAPHLGLEGHCAGETAPLATIICMAYMRQ